VCVCVSSVCYGRASADLNISSLVPYYSSSPPSLQSGLARPAHCLRSAQTHKHKRAEREIRPPCSLLHVLQMG